jgi:hypothetical protein
MPPAEFNAKWLNPPEWTQTRVLEFPGSVDGTWARYIKRNATPLSPGTSAESQSAVAASALPTHSKIGLVRYPRLENAANEVKATPAKSPKPSRAKQADEMI